MPIRHRFRQGDSLFSLAQLHGWTVETLWNHPDNAQLKETREHPNWLEPGDVVVIPDGTDKDLGATTGRRHVFRRKGKRRPFVGFVFRDSNDRPIEGHYVLQFPDGRREPGQLEDGRIYKEDVPDGGFRVHFPGLLEARWSTHQLMLPSDEAVQLTIVHKGLEGKLARISVHPHHAHFSGGDPLWQQEQKLGTPGSLEAEETQLSWQPPALEPGEILSLAFLVEVEEQVVWTERPLLVCRPCPPKPAEPDHIAFTVIDPNGAPVDGHCLLEYPDGHHERRELRQGKLRVKDVPEGLYRLHLPSLGAARWSAAAAEPGETVQLCFEHRSFDGAPEATVSIFAYPPGDAALWSTRHKLWPDPTQPLAARLARVEWSGQGLPTLAPGEGCALTFTVEAGGHRVESERPLVVRKRMRWEAPPPELCMRFVDVEGAPLEGDYLLEHPDGRTENGRLESGCVRCRQPADGDYRVFLPRLLEARWSKPSLQMDDHGEVELEVRQVAVQKPITLSIYQQLGEPIHQLTVTPSGEWARARWRMEGLPPLEPGQGCVVHFCASLDGQEAHSGALIVRRIKSED